MAVSVLRAAGDAFKDFEHPSGTFPAGDAFSAAFTLDEIHKKFSDIHHAGIFIHDDQSAGTHHGADFNQRLIIDLDLQVLFGDAAPAWTADLDRFEFLIIWNTTADFEDNITDSGSHGNFDQTGQIDLT